jgi:hypothetical protein
MALLSDRDHFDRLTCQRIYFADAIGKFVARVFDPHEVNAIEAYARWRAYADPDRTFDSCFTYTSADRRQQIVDAVNALWEESRP